MNNKESEGEDLIADFLDEKAIKYERHVQINGLKDDDKLFREADFYLPEYKVYVEFLGMWNSPEHQQRYRQKMQIYTKNKIPCVYLWPDNLGTLDWILKRRITEVLLKYDKKWQLIKLQWRDYTDKLQKGFMVFFVLMFYDMWKKNQWTRNGTYAIIGVIAIGGIAETYSRVKKIKKIKEGIKW